MKILVPIKQVPGIADVKMDEETGTMIRDGVEAVINPLDLNALAAALNLKDEKGGEVWVITMGPPKAEEAIREALATGADGGYLLSDRAFAGADTWATSYTLSEALKKLGDFELIICGEKATDGDTGQVGPGIASFLDYPLFTYVSKIAVEEDKVKVTRLTETGYENYLSPMPAVLTVVKEVSETRYPSIKGRMKAKKAEVPVWSAEEIGLDTELAGKKGSPTRVVKIFKPKVSREGEIFTIEEDADVDKAADKIIEYLEKNHLL